MPDENIRVKLHKEVLAEMAKTLGTTPGKIAPAVSEAAKEEVNRVIDGDVQTLARQIAKQKVRGELTREVRAFDLVDNKLSGALKGLQHVGERPEAKAILQQNARLYKMKYDAFVTAGFDADQAMKLLLAELNRPRQ